MEKVIILNGPPGAGKNFLAEILEGLSTYDGKPTPYFKECQNKTALHNQAIALSGIPHDEWHSRYVVRELKETPWDKLDGMTQREFLIWISEEVVKPRFGKGYYGEISANKCLELWSKGYTPVFSDGGFSEELKAMTDVLGEENVFVARLYRDGCSFEGDSRNYIFNEVFEGDFKNNSEPGAVINEILSRFFEGPKTKEK